MNISKAHGIGLAVLAAIVLSSPLGCTSSNQSTLGTQTNSSYDSQYRAPTSSSPQSYGEAGAPGEPIEPPITIMQLGMEVNQVNPGEDYYVYGLVDAPDDKALQYCWAVSAGEVSEVPESERGRLYTLVEEKYNTASASAPPPATGPVTDPGTVPAAPGTVPGQTQPGQTQVAPGTQAPGTVPPGTQQPAGPQQPGTQQPGTQQPGTQAPSGFNSSGSGNNVIPPATPPVNDQAGRGGETLAPFNPLSYPAGLTAADASPTIQAIQVKSQTQQITLQELDLWNQFVVDFSGKGGSSIRNGKVLERRFIAGPGDGIPDEDEATWASPPEAAQDDEADEIALPNLSEDVTDATGPSGAYNVAEDTTPQDDVRSGRLDGIDSQRTRSLRDQYESYNGTERNMLYEDDEDDELITADEAFEMMCFVTDDPFITFTPDRPGTYQIFLRMMWKDDELTDPTELQVEATLQEPEISLSSDFPDIVREDSPMYVRIEGEQIPEFHKGLFTVTFDPDVLSFREAELGEFFDNDPGASIFYSEPDKLAGKVIIAVDSNGDRVDLSGSDPLVYLRFEAKRDIESQDETMLALMADTAAQYILNEEGDNILPVPVDRPVYATQMVMPPTLQGSYNRINTPGTQAPAGSTQTQGTGLLAGVGTQPTGPGTQAAGTGQTGPTITPGTVPNQTPVQPGATNQPLGSAPRNPPVTQPQQNPPAQNPPASGGSGGLTPGSAARGGSEDEDEAAGTETEQEFENAGPAAPADEDDETTDTETESEGGTES